MNPRPGIILQARYASVRLPGKALEQVAGRPILQHCLQRLLATGVSRVVLATTTNHEDDALADMGERAGVLVYRGDASDVLGRFAIAAERYQLDPVLRATADNPAVDPEGAHRLLRALRETRADYVQEAGLPIGAAMEVMTAPALLYAASAATSIHDREHVTTFIKAHPDTFFLRTISAPPALTAPSLSLTVDTHEDLERVRHLFSMVGQPDPSLRDLIHAARAERREVA